MFLFVINFTLHGRNNWLSNFYLFGWYMRVELLLINLSSVHATERSSLVVFGL
jgi:hypothetical protein